MEHVITERRCICVKANLSAVSVDDFNWKSRTVGAFGNKSIQAQRLAAVPSTLYQVGFHPSASCPSQRVEYHDADAAFFRCYSKREQFHRAHRDFFILSDDLLKHRVGFFVRRMDSGARKRIVV